MACADCVHNYVVIMLGGAGWSCVSMLKSQLRPQVGLEKGKGEIRFALGFGYFFLYSSIPTKAIATSMAAPMPTMVIV